jgi:hypothetical protein
LLAALLVCGGALGVRPAGAQAPPVCAPAARSVTGHWTTTETVDGENGSFWRGALRLVQRGDRVVGRWEPPGGQPERLVAGSYAKGVLRIAQRGHPALPPAGVEPATSRAWVLTLSSDGAILSGRWTEPADGPAARHGDLFGSGEAGCPATPAAAAAPAASGPERAAGGAPCAAWDLSGGWTTAGPTTAAGPARLWLLQDGASLLGWYETGPAAAAPEVDAAGVPGGLARVAAAPGTAPPWTVDGEVRGTVVRLTLYAGDSLSLSRTLVLAGDGQTLSGAWPPGFGPPETEVLTGHARCGAGGAPQSPGPGGGGPPLASGM